MCGKTAATQMAGWTSNWTFSSPRGLSITAAPSVFTERAYPVEEVLAMLRNAGFEEVQVFDELTFNPPRKDSQRLVFAAKKQGRNESV